MVTKYLTQHLELWNGVWRCKGCSAQIVGSALTHSEDCSQVAALTKPAGGQGRGARADAKPDAKPAASEDA